MKMKRVRKAMTVLIACVMLSGVLAGCGSSSSSSNYKAASDAAYADEAAYESYDSGAEMAMYEDNSAGSSASTKTTENATTTNRKLIRNASLTVETKEFDILFRESRNRLLLPEDI